jgi:hypothetical protein
MDLVRDVLDKAVADRNGREMGRVDGVVAEVQPGRPPTLVAILIGPTALAARLHERLGVWVARLERRLGLPESRPDRIAFSDVDEIGTRIRLTLTAGETTTDAVEQRLRGWVVKLPGSR